MKTTSLLAAALTLLAAVATGCANDGSSPKIKSFVASSQSLPEGGDEVTFTWSVKHAKTIELLPFPGVVTGTSATVSVTEPTIFTLVAKNRDGSDRKRLSLTLGEPFTVHGTLVTFDGQPAANTQMFIDQEVFVTDVNGEFTLENVVPPYDLGVVNANPGGPNFGGGSALYVSVYHGVTRPDPRVLCFSCSGPVSNRSGTMSGTISGGAGFPYPTPTPDPQLETEVVVTGPASSNSNTASGLDGGYDLDLDWSGSTTLPVSVAALQFQNVPEVLFTGFDRKMAQLTDGVDTDVDLALSAVATNHITGSIDAPFEFSGPSAGGWVDFGNPNAGPPAALFGVPIGYSERIDLPSATVSTANTYSLAVPGVTGATYGFYFSVSGIQGGASQVISGVPASTTTVDVELPGLSHLLTPVEGATVTAGTVFSTSAVEGGTYQFNFRSYSGPLFGVGGSPFIQITVYSSTTTVSMPDLSMLGSPAEGRQFSWSAYLYTGFDGVDGLVENAFITPEGNLGYSNASESRYFTYSNDQTAAFAPAHH